MQVSDSNWLKDGAQIAVYFFDDNNNNGWSGFMTTIYDGEESPSYYEVTAPGNNNVWTKIMVVRFDNQISSPAWLPNDAHVWNKTGNISLSPYGRARLLNLGVLTNTIVTFSSNYKDQDRVDDFAIYFNDFTCDICDGTSGPDYGGLLADRWVSIKSEYLHMGSGAQNLFSEHVVGSEVEVLGTLDHAAGLYDYVVSKYGTATLEDFAKRSNVSFMLFSENGISSWNNKIIYNDETTVMIIIITLSSITLLSFSAILLLKIKKKNK